MLEADSSRQVFDPALDQKTDSVFYAYGIMQAIQQLADQYYFQNELRGDLVKTTDKATTHLKDLASFSADATNKYDSVYLYYKVINNCNYYLAHRDTTLQTGAQNVVCNEYAAVASFRAWTYLQLARQYGSAPYITEPVTTIEQINSQTTAANYETILAGEAANLEALKARYTDEQISVPTFNVGTRSAGMLNWGRVEKFISPKKCFIPLNVVLGDIYLELGQYENAAKCYFDYLRYAGLNDNSQISVNYIGSVYTDYSRISPIFRDFTEFPADYNVGQNNTIRGGIAWESSFMHSATPGDVISYIPMAVNYTKGKTTDVPAAFGYNYYGTESKGSIQTQGYMDKVFNCPKNENIQIVPSEAYCDSARNTDYYYFTDQVKVSPFNWNVKSFKAPDARAAIVEQGIGADSIYVYTYKPSTAYILLYRNATVWLHLAEAMNRMGYPDAAFAVLKNGIHAELENYRYLEVWKKDLEGNDVLDETESHVDDKYYITPATYELLTTKLPFLAQENSDIFKNGTSKSFIGIHFHGCGATEYMYSPYRFSNVVGSKIKALGAQFKDMGININVDAPTKNDSIEAMEDLLCDEYAMEFAFEGTRYSDLRRLALHKNRAATYGADFGDLWLSEKLKNNKAGVTTKNCYLPFK